jgi:hypothetical protein
MRAWKSAIGRMRRPSSPTSTGRSITEDKRMSTETKNTGRFLLADGLALVALALAIALRIWGAWAARCITEPDPGVVALMARHMAALKDFPVFFYGQAYMGSLEPMASALMVRLLGSTGFAVTLGPVLFAAAALVFLWRWARDAAGPWGGLAALLAGMFGPSAYFQFQSAPRGGYMVALWVDALALFAAARMATRLHEGQKVGLGKFLALGLLAGVGMWSNMIVVSALGVSVLMLWHGMRWKFWKHARGIVAGLAGFLVGLAPWLVYNVRQGWTSLEMSQIGGHAPLREALHNSWDRLLLLQDAGKSAAGPYLPVILAVAVLGLAAAGAWIAVAQLRTSSSTENYARAGAILFCAIFALVFATSGFTRTHTARYWVPLVPGLAVLSAVACAAPGRFARRAALWVFLSGLVLVQGSLCVPALRASSLRAETSLAAYREIGQALERIGVDSLMAPIQLFSLNFALDERFAVSNGKQKFYEPILRQVELSDATAYSSDFNGIEPFLRQQGAEWEATAAGGRTILWNVHRPAVALQEIPPGEIGSLRDGAGAEWKPALLDRNLDTWWSPGATGAATLEWNFAVPQEVYSVQLLFAHGLSDEAFDFPRRIRIEAKVAGEWRTVRADEPLIPLEWSGPRIYFPSGLARMEYRVDVKSAESLRIGLLDTQVQDRRVGWRLAEAMLFGAEDGTPPAMEVAAVDDLGQQVRKLKADAVVYAPRWVSNQLLKRGWMPEARLAGLSGRVFAPEPGMPRDGTLAVDRPGVFIVEKQYAAAIADMFEGRYLSSWQKLEGPWAVFAVDPEGWTMDGLGLPPAVIWTGDTLLAGNTAARVGEALRRLRAGGDSEDVQKVLLHDILRWRPSALSALTEERVRDLGGEDAVQARQDAARFPEKSCPTEFANGIRLEGADLAISAVPAGKYVVVHLYWSARDDFEAGQEIVFIHFRDAGGNIVAQDDYRGSPLLWGSPTVRPVSGECVEDVRRIAIPATVTPGALSLSVGLYQPKNGRRVKIVQSAAPEIHRHAATWPDRLQVLPAIF